MSRGFERISLRSAVCMVLFLWGFIFILGFCFSPSSYDSLKKIEGTVSSVEKVNTSKGHYWIIRVNNERLRPQTWMRIPERGDKILALVEPGTYHGAHFIQELSTDGKLVISYRQSYLEQKRQLRFLYFMAPFLVFIAYIGWRFQSFWKRRKRINTNLGA
jgi:hypothetical protein